MNAHAASARRWKEARRSRAAERDASGGGAPRALKRAWPTRARLGVRRAVTTAAVVVIGGGSSVLACPVCFGAEETTIVAGTKLGVVVMLAITLTVQGGFVGFFLYLRKRAKRTADVDFDTEWSELQRASRTS